MRPENKKKRTKSIIILSVAAILAAAAGAAVSVPLTMVNQYKKTSYEYVEVVEREDEYVMEEYPEVIIDTSGMWQEGVDLAEETEMIETEPESEPLPETEAAPETEAEPETEPETEPEPVPETEEDKETEIIPETAAEEVSVPVTEPAVKEEQVKTPETAIETAAETKAETTAETEAEKQTAAQSKPAESKAPTTAQKPKPNYNASFSNSENAVSVYGSTPIYKKDRKDSDIINILLMGTDSNDITADRGRSDTMLVLSYNKKEGTVKLISFLRDSLVPIEGYDWNRLNTAYFFGGAGLAINTINQLFDLDIQDFVIIDFNGVKDFIDYIGGVDITLTEEEAALYSKYTGREIKAGPNHLDAQLTLIHTRNRTIGTDFGRTQRQRDTIMAIMTQMLNEKSIVEITETVEYAFSLVKTNISVKTMLSLAASVIGHASSLTVESANIPYSDSYQFAWYNKMAIISFDIKETAKKLNAFIYD